jgi:hypothetical protein
MAPRERDGRRHYYRLRTADHQIFDVYFDTVSRIWVLDVIQD